MTNASAGKRSIVPNTSRYERSVAGAAPVQRVELLASLAVTEARVVWVAASPGCGKTTLLAQYADAARARGERVSWLSLDESDSDARELAVHLCYALARLRSAGDSARDR